MAGRRYRSKVEVFRDLLVATRQSSKKTRIIGLANLNPSTFRRHMEVAVSQGLVSVVGGDYLLTERANRALEAFDAILTMSRDLDNVVQTLKRTALYPGAEHWVAGQALRHISPKDWNGERAAGAVPPATFDRSGATTSVTGKILALTQGRVALVEGLPGIEAPPSSTRSNRRSAVRPTLVEPLPVERSAERTRL